MTPTGELASQLAAKLAPVLGADVAVENLRALTGGASRSTWAFDAVTGDRRHALILRTGAPDDVHAGMELEARAQAAAAAAGAPVPHVLIADDSPAALGNPFLICDEIAGETIVRRIQRQLDAAGGQGARAGLLRQCAQALAAIHRADPRIPGLAREDRSRSGASGSTPWATPPPPSKWAFRWLEAHRPEPSADLCWCTVTTGWAT